MFYAVRGGAPAKASVFEKPDYQEGHPQGPQEGCQGNNNGNQSAGDGGETKTNGNNTHSIQSFGGPPTIQ